MQHLFEHHTADSDHRTRQRSHAEHPLHCNSRGQQYGHGRHGDREGYQNRLPGGSRGGNERHLVKGRKFSADDIQLLLLHFIADKANYGYELIKLFATRSHIFIVQALGSSTQRSPI